MPCTFINPQNHHYCAVKSNNGWRHTLANRQSRSDVMRCQFEGPPVPSPTPVANSTLFVCDSVADSACVCCNLGGLLTCPVYGDWLSIGHNSSSLAIAHAGTCSGPDGGHGMKNLVTMSRYGLRQSRNRSKCACDVCTRAGWYVHSLYIKWKIRCILLEAESLLTRWM